MRWPPVRLSPAARGAGRVKAGRGAGNCRENPATLNRRPLRPVRPQAGGVAAPASGGTVPHNGATGRPYADGAGRAGATAKRRIGADASCGHAVGHNATSCFPPVFRAPSLQTEMFHHRFSTASETAGPVGVAPFRPAGGSVGSMSISIGSRGAFPVFPRPFLATAEGIVLNFHGGGMACRTDFLQLAPRSAGPSATATGAGVSTVFPYEIHRRGGHKPRVFHSGRKAPSDWLPRRPNRLRAGRIVTKTPRKARGRCMIHRFSLRCPRARCEKPLCFPQPPRPCNRRVPAAPPGNPSRAAGVGTAWPKPCSERVTACPPDERSRPGKPGPKAV